MTNIVIIFICDISLNNIQENGSLKIILQCNLIGPCKVVIHRYGGSNCQPLSLTFLTMVCFKLTSLLILSC